jgi:lysophospholipase L1-like esterase
VLLDTLNRRERPSYLVGILPRIHIERELVSRIIGLNERVKNHCKGTKVTFIDLWDSFKNNDYLYSRDGLHLSKAGSALYGTLIHDIVMPVPEVLGF